MATVAAIPARGWSVARCFWRGPRRRVEGGKSWNVTGFPGFFTLCWLCFPSLGFKAMPIGVVLGVGEEKLVRISKRWQRCWQKPPGGPAVPASVEMPKPPR